MARHPTTRAIDGALALAAAMGIGRFAYTALLPGTQRALAIADDVAGAIASVNLVGYLAGVLAARQLASRAERGAVLRGALAATALATAAGAATTSVAAWFALRLAAGIASGLVFVLASAAALEAASAHAGLLYAGVGAGIALSGAVAVQAPAGFGAPWLLLALAAAALGARGFIHLATAPPPPHSAAIAGAAPPALGFGPLAAAYFLEGLGYIVSGTFAVAAVRRTPGLEALAPWTWVLTGVAAAPSAVLWSAAGRRLGHRGALALAFLVQAVGIALPALSTSAGAALAGAALFGGTFMGITTLAMAVGRSLAPASPGRIVGTLTAVYGVGQILGPLLAGAVSHRLGETRPAVLGAAVAVALGGALVAGGARPR
ncbi:MAG TPA: YbfB/YjiJ family MFS transporter [Anaeromyxobacter sp.]|jgi:MFS family permease|nr:YbfB/YjiJ family MFS transporter [Anaeromyxobacter sp.]